MKVPRDQWPRSASAPAAPHSFERDRVQFGPIEPWELDEASGCRVLYRRGELSIADEHRNVSGGAIAGSGIPEVCGARGRSATRSSMAGVAAPVVPS